MWQSVLLRVNYFIKPIFDNYCFLCLVWFLQLPLASSMSLSYLIWQLRHFQCNFYYTERHIQRPHTHTHTRTPFFHIYLKWYQKEIAKKDRYVIFTLSFGPRLMLMISLRVGCGYRICLCLGKSNRSLETFIVPLYCLGAQHSVLLTIRQSLSFSQIMWTSPSSDLICFSPSYFYLLNFWFKGSLCLSLSVPR